MNKERIPTERIIECLRETNGLVSLAAEVLLTGFLSGLGACGVFSVVKKRAE